MKMLVIEFADDLGDLTVIDIHAALDSIKADLELDPSLVLGVDEEVLLDYAGEYLGVWSLGEEEE